MPTGTHGGSFLDDYNREERASAGFARHGDLSGPGGGVGVVTDRKSQRQKTRHTSTAENWCQTFSSGSLRLMFVWLRVGLMRKTVVTDGSGAPIQSNAERVLSSPANSIAVQHRSSYFFLLFELQNLIIV